MPIVDAHVHLYPPEVERDPAAWAAAQGERHWAVLCTRRRRDGRPVQALPSEDALLRAMDDAGIHRAVLLGWYWERFETCRWQNRFYVGCVGRHPDRLAACATFHPNGGLPAVLDDLRLARDEGLVGLGELSPHSQGYPMDDPVFRSVLETAAEWHWPVNLHVTDPESRPYAGRVDTPLADFVRLVHAFPRTTFVLAHWGGLAPLREPEIRARDNVYYDTAASPLLYDATIWSRFSAVVPANRILFGSDYPLNLYPRVSVAAEMRRFADEAQREGATSDLLHANAASLFFDPLQGPR